MAIKRLRKDVFKHGVNLGAIKELQAMQELEHPNVLAVRAAPRERRCNISDAALRPGAIL